MASSARAKGQKAAELSLNRFAKDVKRIPIERVEVFARRVENRIKTGIRAQTFKMSRLTLPYLEWKIAMGYDKRILIRTGAYLDSIRSYKSGKRGWAVRIHHSRKVRERKGLTMQQLAQYLEFGTRNMPARPHWRPTSAWVEKAWPRYFKKELRKVQSSVRRS